MSVQGNILSNPTLATNPNLKTVVHYDDHEDKIVYGALGWVGPNVQNTIPGSLQIGPNPWDVPNITPAGAGGMTYDASYKPFTSDWRKVGQPTEANQRYLAKVTLRKTDLAWAEGQGGDSPLQVMVTAFNGPEVRQGAWQVIEVGEGTQELIWLFQSNQALTVDFVFKFWCKFGAIKGHFDIVSLELLKVTEDYGENPLPIGDEEPGGTPAINLNPWILGFGGVLVFFIAVLLYLLLKREGVTLVQGLPITPLPDAASMLLAVIATIIAGVATSPAGSAIVQLIKGIVYYTPWKEKVSADAISFVVACVLTLIGWLAGYFNVQPQVNSLIDLVAQAVPIILSVMSLYFGQKGVYLAARWIKMPVLGARKT